MKREYLFIGLGIGSALLYLLVVWGLGAAGYPLDDAWIHQTYARNLGWYGQWAFVMGQPSAGSTSPLWTIFLALGYALHLNPFIWTQALNAVLLGLTVWLVYKLSGVWWVAVLAALEWHLVWAATSGMETILFCGLVLAVWWTVQIAKEDWRVYTASGLLIGLSVWTRPDGLTLLPFCLLVAWLSASDWPNRFKRAGSLMIGAALILLPYFLFNVALSGQLWPNTFFAKQAEYAILLQTPLWQRLVQILTAPLVGSLVLVLPGLLLNFRRSWIMLAWVLAFLLSYVLRLPVTYQHARYLIPVVPVLLAVAGAGAATWLQLKSEVPWRRILSRAWALGLVLIGLAFWGLGLNALIADNKVINGEMVTTAHWVADHVPEGTLVAAHDIGALGYFANVQLLDMAGLVSPQVIPYMGNDDRLWKFAQQGGAQYLITYPGWCPAFTQSPKLHLVFATGSECTPSAPNLHMMVYEVLP